MSHIPDRNPSIVLARKCEEDSTMNLLCHVKSCEGQVVDASKSIANYAHGSMYSKAKLHYLVSLWVFKCHRPFTIINDEPLQRILQMLYARVETLSATTISRDVKEICSIAKVKVRKVLQVWVLSFFPTGAIWTDIWVISSNTLDEYTWVLMDGPRPIYSRFLGS